MTYYYPCTNCAQSPSECTRRQAVRDALRGLSVTSLKFKCDERKSKFSEGQRISFPWRIFESTDYGDADETTAVFHGTIMYEASNTRYVVRVDPGKCFSIHDDDWDKPTAESVFTRASGLKIKVKTPDIAPLAEKPRPICMNCGAYDDEPKCHWHEDDIYSYRPVGCRKRSAASQPKQEEA